jgi:hypothetical protein
MSALPDDGFDDLVLREMDDIFDGNVHFSVESVESPQESSPDSPDFSDPSPAQINPWEEPRYDKFTSFALLSAVCGYFLAGLRPPSELRPTYAPQPQLLPRRFGAPGKCFRVLEKWFSYIFPIQLYFHSDIACFKFSLSHSLILKTQMSQEYLMYFVLPVQR